MCVWSTHSLIGLMVGLSNTVPRYIPDLIVSEERNTLGRQGRGKKRGGKVIKIGFSASS